METKYDILIQNKRDIQFKFTIRRKFTILRGNRKLKDYVRRIEREGRRPHGQRECPGRHQQGEGIRQQ